MKHLVFAAAAFLGLSVNALAADVTCSDNAMVKNLRSYASHCVTAQTPHQLTKREIKHLMATARTPSDHLAVARYYEAQADWLESRAGSLEEAAADARHNPSAKNVASPTASARYEYIAKNDREKAKSDRAIAVTQQQLATSTSVAEAAQN